MFYSVLQSMGKCLQDTVTSVPNVAALLVSYTLVSMSTDNDTLRPMYDVLTVGQRRSNSSCQLRNSQTINLLAAGHLADQQRNIGGLALPVR